MYMNGAETLGKVTFLNPDQKPDARCIIEILFGMTTEELAQEIRNNKDGKYDAFYSKEDQEEVIK